MPREVAVLPRSSCPVPYSAPDSAQGGTGILWACPEGEGGGEGTGDPIRSLRESWPLQALLGRQSGWVGGPESRALPSWCVWVCVCGCGGGASSEDGCQLQVGKYFLVSELPRHGPGWEAVSSVSQEVCAHRASRGGASDG